MRKKSDNIVSFTSGEITRRQAKGEMLSDWKKAALQPLPNGSDPDDAMPDDGMPDDAMPDDGMEQANWATAELPMPRPKVHASLRLDADMLDWFKGQGRGYQTKINAVLRSYFQQHGR